ncbi:mobilization protein [Parapedobacter defluvii]|uniref:Mobilization protein n=1 Tax=Parapedobacter defluvii TaxID=2045106 RepID=A0ABQ1MKX3_9SPHI|nr:relaxase/mobilization nuclease domain-containing protein [Parapedobacter defluvii]GGC42424.1 mobilization protein [Parapedobacter defluvii]
MVAKIISGKDIGGVLHYNEHKVEEGVARLILASGFAGEIADMDMQQKKQRFEHLTMLNGRVKTNTLHISLNFDPAEKINDEKMQQIAIDYMERIDFGDQPYIVYRHHDAAHPHIHIATVNIQPNGKRIDIHNIGRTKSEEARQEIEEKYKLVKARGREQEQGYGIKPVEIEKAIYGKSQTKRAITNVVGAVVKEYSFTSLAELNAALSQYNVVAHRGNESSRMYERGGLQFSLTDENGKRIGIPIKASALYGKPTLANLEKRFERNAENRKRHKDSLKQHIDKAMESHTQFTDPTFINELAKQGIHAVFRQSEQGQLYGITYVDNVNKTIFNGSDLGKEYGAKSISGTFGPKDIPNGTKQKLIPKAKTTLPRPRLGTFLHHVKSPTNYLKAALEMSRPQKYGTGDGKDLLETLLGKTTPDYAPRIPKKKKKKGRRISR